MNFRKSWIKTLPTAKRLSNSAQGCRAARLPWDRVVEVAQPQRGCVCGRKSNDGANRNVELNRDYYLNLKD